MLDYVIEHVDKLALSSDDKLDLFRILAEMCPFSTEFDRPKERLAKLFHVLMVKSFHKRFEQMIFTRFSLDIFT